jgi:hypothetical protein
MIEAFHAWPSAMGYATGTCVGLSHADLLVLVRDRPARERISLLVDADVLEAWRASGPGYLRRMNALLREHKP